jgi:hypothetical protein
MENVDKKSTFSISTIIFTVMSFCLPLAGLVVWWLQKRTIKKSKDLFNRCFVGILCQLSRDIAQIT